MPVLNQSFLQSDFEKMLHPENDGKTWEGLEWYETNGLGGWAASTLTGCNSRRYHGLLVAATKPPTERMVLLSKMDEIIAIGDERYHLGTNTYTNAVAPCGYQYLTGFRKDLFPEFMYEAGGVSLTKTIAAIQDENTTVVFYSVKKAEQPFTLKLLPLISGRGYHSLQRANDAMSMQAVFENSVFSIKPYGHTPTVYISVPGGSFRYDPKWFYNFEYMIEKYRGQDFHEDLFNHGTLSITLKEGDTLGIIISTEDPAGRNAFELFAKETLRRDELLLKQQGDDDMVRLLTLAADEFIVQRDKDLKTVIAGYPWFTDWGRDTMISLPGLCISTGRFEEAKKILEAFNNSVSEGMLPNRFTDKEGEPEYNNVDGTLWYFIAVYKYLKASGDKEFVLKEVLPVLKDIIDWHYKGTRFNIKADPEDGLLYAGVQGQQLTWMDAKVGDWVVTPRMGKPVEVQALWYNAQEIFSELLSLNQQHEDAVVVRRNAQRVKEVFLKTYWYAEGNYLYDVINENGKADKSFRPNQLFAISLPFSLIEGKEAEWVLKQVEEKLLTPVGLRSLAPDDAHYIGLYRGGVLERDGAYHQGTVWSWLLGAYVDALMKTQQEVNRLKALKVISDISFHFKEEGCVGSVSEIFDGDAPHAPRGCPAQAWGVAELLRVIKDYHLR